MSKSTLQVMKDIVNVTSQVVHSVGRSYILLTLFMMYAALKSFTNDRNATIDVTFSAAFFVLVIVGIVVYCMWRRSTSRFRNVIVALMLSETIIQLGFLLSGNMYSPVADIITTVLWFVGVYLLYTGPSFKDIVEIYRLVGQ